MVTELEGRGPADRWAAETPAGAGELREVGAAEGWLARYDTGGFYDEMFAAPGKARPHYERLYRALAEFGPEEFRRRGGLADVSLMHQGITFTVYSDQRGVERPW